MLMPQVPHQARPAQGLDEGAAPHGEGACEDHGVRAILRLLGASQSDLADRLRVYLGAAIPTPAPALMLTAPLDRYFSAAHQSSTFFDEAKILSYLPLALSRDLSVQLYGTILSQSPMFKGLGQELRLRCAPHAALPSPMTAALPMTAVPAVMMP
jgi:hypothetical protein